jgi:ribonucleoside-diphosphate reductase beta chain
MEPEPFLEPSNRRYTLFPLQHLDIWDAFQTQKASFWNAEEISLEQDVIDWPKLTSGEQHFIKNVLAFFAGSDGIVTENLLQRFTADVPVLEVTFFYSLQAHMECVHSLTYSLLIDALIKDTREKNRLFNAIETISVVKLKADWAIKWIESDTASFASRLIAFLIVEGIFFSGSFCALFWLKERGVMPGLTFSNELISRDENMHASFAVLLYSKLVNKLSEKDIHDMFKEAVELETKFITESIPCDLIGMNSIAMSDYIKYVADFWLVKLGHAKIWSNTNPFPFMERISMSKVSKQNFFEGRNPSYNIASVVGGDANFDLELEEF